MDTLLEILTNTYQTTSAALLAHAPRVLATIVVVFAGLIVTRMAKAAVLALMESLKVEDISSKVGATAALKRAQVGLSMNEILANLVYWTFLVFTTLVALTTLGIADASTFASLGAIVPKVIVASTILILGLNLSAFLSKLIQTAAVNAEVRQARMVRNVAHYGMGTLVLVLALRQLGLPEELLSTGFMIMFASAGAAFALAFGLGARDLAANIAKTSWKSEREQLVSLAEASNLGRDVIPRVPSIAPQSRGRAATAAQ